MIHPTAIIEDGARLGADCEIHAHAIIRRHAVLGDRVVVHPFAVIGGDPQYLRFDPSTESTVNIGSHCVLREHVTINRSIYAGKATVVGENCLIMAGCHVAHDCVLGNQVIMTNLALLAGHVELGNFTIMGGASAVHQFVRVGEGVMLGGAGRMSRDLAPYIMANERDCVVGLNLLGLKRRGVPREAIRELKELFQSVYRVGGNYRKNAAAQQASGRFQSEEAQRFLSFFATGKRGFAQYRGSANADSED